MGTVMAVMDTVTAVMGMATDTGTPMVMDTGTGTGTGAAMGTGTVTGTGMAMGMAMVAGGTVGGMVMALVPAGFGPPLATFGLATETGPISAEL